MKKRQYRVVLTFALIFGFFGLLQAASLSKEFRQVFHFPQGGQVDLSNINGKISAESWDVDSVEVYAMIKVKARNREDVEAFMKKVKIVIDNQTNRLMIEPDYPKRRGGGLLDWIFGRRVEVSIEFSIKVPSRTNLSLKSVNGEVDVDNVKGKCRLRTTNGKIKAEGIEGSVNAYTVNGRIGVQLAKVDQESDMSFRTVNGAIELYLPEAARADIEASCVNGGISTDFPLEVTGKFNSKRLRGTLNGGGGLINLRAVNGGIHIYKE